MPWTERKLTERFGIELSGERIGLALSQADRQAVRAATARHGVTAGCAAARLASPVLGGQPSVATSPLGDAGTTRCTHPAREAA